MDNEARIKRVKEVKERLKKLDLAHFYSNASAKDKKKIRASIEKNIAARKAQLKYVEQIMVAPIKLAATAGVRVLKSEISLEEYLYVETETQKYLTKVFTEIVEIAPKKVRK